METCSSSVTSRALYEASFAGVSITASDAVSVGLEVSSMTAWASSSGEGSSLVSKVEISSATEDTSLVAGSLLER